MLVICSPMIMFALKIFRCSPVACLSVALNSHSPRFKITHYWFLNSKFLRLTIFTYLKNISRIMCRSFSCTHARRFIILFECILSKFRDRQQQYVRQFVTNYVLEIEKIFIRFDWPFKCILLTFLPASLLLFILFALPGIVCD